MAAKEINSKASGNNNIEKSSGSELKINTQNIADERISTELLMQHFANTLLNQNAIDDKTYRKLMGKSAWKSIADTESRTEKLCKTLPKQVSIP